MHRLQAGAASERLPVIQLLGPDSISKQLVARHVRRRAWAGSVYRLPGGAAAGAGRRARNPGPAVAAREHAAAARRSISDARGRGRHGRPTSAPPLNRFLARCGVVTFLDTREAQRRSGTLNAACRSTSTNRRLPSSRRPGPRRSGSDGRRQPGAAGRPVQPQSARDPPDCRGRRSPKQQPTSRRRACPRPALGGLPAAARGRGSTRWRSASSPRRPGTTSCCPTEATGAAAADRRAGRTAQHSLRRLGLSPQDEPRPRHQRAVCRRERHRQDHGRRGDRQRAAARTSTASTCRRW